MSRNPKNRQEVLVCGETYHIYNKAVGSELLFKGAADYEWFLKKLERFVLPIADIFTYCLIPNHFHLLLTIKEPDEIFELQKLDEDDYSNYLSHVFGNFFNSYSKSFNKMYDRVGRLFFQPFKRIAVEDEDYFILLVNYIHRNPIHHGLVKEMSDWKYSSYNAIASNKPTSLNRA
jgi:REP element-mobilizing transposase RayT